MLLFPLLLGSGKLADQQEIPVLLAGDSYLVFLLDSLSGLRLLVDTEALFQSSLSPQLQPLLPPLPLVFSQLVEPLFLALGTGQFCSILALDVSPGPSSWLKFLFPSLAQIFSAIMLSWLMWLELVCWMQTLWMFSLLSPLPPPGIRSVLISRLLLERSGTSL